MSTILHSVGPSSCAVVAAPPSRISNTSRTAWMIFVVPSVRTRMPFKRWISKSSSSLGLLPVGEDGSFESQRTERSQASTRGIWLGVIGG